MYVTPKYKDELIKNQEYKDLLKSLKSGHLYSDKKRIDLNIKQIDFFSFDTQWGTTFVISYMSDDNELFKYMGNNPPQLNNDGYTTVKATIKHDNYKDIDETKIQRIKVAKIKEFA